MPRITCTEAVDAVIARFPGVTADHLDDSLSSSVPYLGNEIEDAAFAYVEGLPNKEKLSIWMSCDDEVVSWRSAPDYSSDKHMMLIAFAAYAIIGSIKAKVAAA